MKTVSITPGGVGWLVNTDISDNPMIFRSGARAEETAVRLAQALADHGELVQVKIGLRDGTESTRTVAPFANDRFAAAG